MSDLTTLADSQIHYITYHYLIFTLIYVLQIILKQLFLNKVPMKLN